MKIKTAPQTIKMVLTRPQKLAIYTRDKFRCTLCNKDLSGCNYNEIKTAQFYFSETRVLPGNHITVCAPKCIKRGTINIRRYRDLVFNSPYLKDMETRLNATLNTDHAKKVLSGSLPGINPWDTYKVKKAKDIGVRKIESTTQGNQNISRLTRLAIYIRDDFKCLYCWKSLRKENPLNITLNCFIPVPTGRRIPENLVTCCKLCSLKKRNKDWRKELLKGGKLQRVETNLDRPLAVYKNTARAVLEGESEAFPNPWKIDSKIKVSE
jgi:hypothetical protein